MIIFNLLKKVFKFFTDIFEAIIALTFALVVLMLGFIFVLLI